MKHLLLAVAALGMAASPAYAAPCKDAKGKFTKCPEKPKRCKDAKGKFAKCGAPGAKPM